MRNYLHLLVTFIALTCISSLSFGQATVVPTIDGDGSDAAWNIATPVPITTVITNTNITDADDLSGTIQVLWSADSLYYLVKVKDDTMYGGAGAAYNYDNCDIYFDAFNKATPKFVDSTQVYWDMNWWRAENPMGGRTGTGWTTPPGNFAYDTVNGTGYTLELAVAWSAFGKTAQVSDVIGFDVKLSDCDGPVDAETRDQIAFRDYTDGGWDNPRKWGELLLKADGSTVATKDFPDAADGSVRDWGFIAAPVVPLNSVIVNTNITDAADASANFQLKWDIDNLYVLVKEQDDILYHGSANVWEDDNTTVYLDPFNSKAGTYADSTIANWEKDWWTDGAIRGTAGKPSTWGMAINEGSDYTLELTIPFSYAFDYDQVSPTVGDIMGFDVKICDRDVAEEPRDQLTWMDITDQGWNNPSLFGAIQLQADGLVKAFARPGAASDVAAAAETSTVTVTWGASAAAGSYDVYRNGALAQAGLTETTFVQEEVADGEYTYKVRTRDTLGVLSLFSNEAVVTVIGGGVHQNVAELTKVYPNPAYNVLNIESVENIQSITIINITGKVVKTIQGNGMVANIAIDDLSDGIYMVNVQFETAVANYKVIVK